MAAVGRGRVERSRVERELEWGLRREREIEWGLRREERDRVGSEERGERDRVGTEER